MSEINQERPEILDVETERKVLRAQLIRAAIGAARSALGQDRVTTGQDWLVFEMTVDRILRHLRVMSARQLAVLLAVEANPHEESVTREPLGYTPAEIEDVS